jgi:sensor histidine kinase regulating citrate/malate metabolism
MSVKKLSRMLFLVNSLQLLLGAGILLGLWSGRIEYSEEILILSIFLVLFSSLLTMAGLFSMTRYQRKNYIESIENLENLNTKLREQRHDYLNQLQIVHGLLELEEYEAARDYIRPVFKDIMKVNRALRTSQPAVNALLQAKMEAAEQQGIDFYLEVGTSLKQLPVEAWELCKILANLIDNAVAAVSQNEGEKKICLKMGENSRGYCFIVSNNGPEIQPAQKKQIFSRGYTTKKGEGHGLGLSIVLSILEEAGGEIRVESSGEETAFSFMIPKTEK